MISTLTRFIVSSEAGEAKSTQTISTKNIQSESYHYPPSPPASSHFDRLCNVHARLFECLAKQVSDKAAPSRTFIGTISEESGNSLGGI